MTEDERTISAQIPRPDTVKATIARLGIVAVFRASTERHFVSVAHTLVEAGVDVLELTLTTPKALEALAAIKEQLPKEVAVGAGTVVSERDAAACIDAGADFLVAPWLAPEVVRVGSNASTPVFPGALTPTEFVAASQLGATLVKLFPASVMGPEYLKDLKQPLPHIEVMPTGGIRLDQISLWLQAGALAVGLGRPLLGDSLEGGSLDKLRQRAKLALDSVHAARNQG